MNKALTTILTVAIVGVLAAGGYFVYTTISRSGKSPVTINAAPNDADITLGDTKLRPGTHYLEPGNYHVKATKDGFAPYETDITLPEDATEPQIVSIALEPLSEEAQQYAIDNQEQYQTVEAAAGTEYHREGEEFIDKNPITADLPVSTMLYTIGYKLDPDDPSEQSIIIEIDAARGYRNAAVGELRDMGYNPTDFKINFREYKNPFNE